MFYKHINFQNKLNNSFPYFWFCKPNIIKEYELDFVELSSHSEYNLELERDILDLSDYSKKIEAIKSYLKSGDVYQINFTDKKFFHSTFENSFDLYNSL